MTFSGDLGILEDFIEKFKSYLKEITKENEEIDALMSGFSDAIRVAGNNYDANTNDWRVVFVNAKNNLETNLEATVKELTELLTNARAAAAALGNTDSSTSNVEKTIP